MIRLLLVGSLAPWNFLMRLAAFAGSRLADFCIVRSGARADREARALGDGRGVRSAGRLAGRGGGESLQFRPGDVKLWNSKTGELAASLEMGHPTNVWATAWSSRRQDAGHHRIRRQGGSVERR